MKKLFITLAFVLLAAGSYAAGLQEIVPLPKKAVATKGTFRLTGTPIKCDDRIDAKTQNAIHRFAAQLGFVSGKPNSVSTPIGLKDAVESGAVNGMVFLLDTSLGQEAYRIDAGPRLAVIRASGFNGFFYAIQTLKQLLPAAVYGKQPVADLKLNIPCCSIEDEPAFGYRGAMLDCGRHIFSVEEVKKFLDVMAMYKLNRFHWHLTEDQGWRIESKKYPLLTQMGAYRGGTQVGHDKTANDGIRYGGFYTQEEIKDIVVYADNLGITVIPEIDLPGHMVAAMASYPWLGCTGGPYEVRRQWGIADQVLCPGKETTFKFLEDILGEVAELFPGEYFDIGGDECPKKEWEKCPDCQAKIKALGLTSDAEFSAEQRLQSYVTNRVQKFLASKGKKIIGWDEILEGDLEAGATVMSWRGTKGGIKASSMGFDVIMTPTAYCYFDYLQSDDRAAEPFGYPHGTTLNVEKVYSFNPLEGIEPENQKHIIGVQANMWTEYIQENWHLEYMLLPRLLAMSEVQWCEPSLKDFTRFRTALANHEIPVLEAAGYNYRKLD